jgi:hypothetical protein
MSNFSGGISIYFFLEIIRTKIPKKIKRLKKDTKDPKEAI